VREISITNEVARLRSFDGKTLESELFRTESNVADTNPETICSDFINELKKVVLIEEQRVSDIGLFIQSALLREEECPSQYLLAPCASKELRTSIHQLVKNYLTVCVLWVPNF
jgi:hypothetical protein